MNIVVIGGGAMGLAHAALLSRVANTTLLTRRAEQAEQINTKGISIHDADGTSSVDKVTASSDPAVIDPADLVIVAVKTFDNERVLALLTASPNKTFAVMSIQNGLAHNQQLADALGSHRLLLGKTGYAAHRIDDTTVGMTGIGETVFGERDGALSDRVRNLEQLCQAVGVRVEASTEMPSVVWSKFAQACCQNALSALTRQPFQALRPLTSARELLLALSDEMKALAAAIDVPLQFDPYERLLKNWDGLNHRSSMAQDVEAGRPTEIEALNGHAVRLGEQYGVPTPVNRTMYLLVSALPAKKTNVKDEVVIEDDDPRLIKLREICSELSDVTETREWMRVVFSTNGQPFTAYGGDHDFPQAIMFRPDEDEIETLLANPLTLAFSQLSQHPWLSRIVDSRDVDWNDVARLVHASYAKIT